MDIFYGRKILPMLVTFVLHEYFTNLIFAKTITVATTLMESLTGGKNSWIKFAPTRGDGKI